MIPRFSHAFTVVPAALLLWAISSNPANGAGLIEHRLQIADPASHYLEIESRFPAAAAEQELMMAVWTPGSYLVREFSRHLEDFSASSDGTPLKVLRTAKNRWRVVAPAGSAITVRYRVYAREMSVRTSFVDAEFGLVNPTTVFLAPVGHLDLPHEVRFELPPAWRAYSALEERNGAFRATDYHHLADSPLVFGQGVVSQFEVRDVTHFIVHVGDHRFWDLQRAAADVARLVSRQLLFWGQLPSPRPYYFLNLISEAGGGLEHAQSTVLMTSRWAMRSREDYIDWLELVSHEYFHVWNVKQLRPAGLEVYDYENENYVRGLWLSEGFTSYYAPLLLIRAGLMTPREFFKQLAKRIRDLETRPGRLVKSTQQASFEAWIKHYRPDENSVNSTVSYYNKGAILGFLLDARIRTASNDRHTLDDLMRDLYADEASDEGFTTTRVAELASARAGEELTSWFAQFVTGTEPLDYAEALDWYGLELLREAEPEDPEDAFQTPPRSSLGITVKAHDGRLLVTEVPRNSVAFRAGINVEDELVAINQVRVEADPAAWKELFDRLRVGDPAEILLARRGRLLEVDAVLQAEIAEEWIVQRRADSNHNHLDRLRRWLGRGWFVSQSD